MVNGTAGPDYSPSLLVMLPTTMLSNRGQVLETLGTGDGKELAMDSCS